jgi:hypothetical protein
MLRMCSVLLLLLMLCTPIFSQDSGITQCDPDMKQIPAWTAPGSAFLVDNIACGQSVSIVGLEKGYFKVKLGDRFAYVNAKYVQLPEAGLPQKSPESTIDKAPSGKLAQSLESKRVSPRRHRIGIAFELSYIQYIEPGLMEESGPMFGVSGAYPYRTRNFMFKLDGAFKTGNVEYSSVQGSSKIRDYFFESRFSFGRNIASSDKLRLTPFVGVGYRYLFDTLSKAKTTAILTYDRTSNYLYSPIGMDSAFFLKNGWSIELSAEYDLFWHGWQINDNYRLLGTSISGGEKITNNQNGGWGTRASLAVVKSLKAVSFAVEPFVKYWNISESDHFPIPETGLFLYEPQNSSKEWGTRIGIRF